MWGWGQGGRLRSKENFIGISTWSDHWWCPWQYHQPQSSGNVAVNQARTSNSKLHWSLENADRDPGGLGKQSHFSSLDVFFWAKQRSFQLKAKIWDEWNLKRNCFEYHLSPKRCIRRLSVLRCWMPPQQGYHLPSGKLWNCLLALLGPPPPTCWPWLSSRTCKGESGFHRTVHAPKITEVPSGQSYTNTPEPLLKGQGAWAGPHSCHSRNYPGESDC